LTVFLRIVLEIFRRIVVGGMLFTFILFVDLRLGEPPRELRIREAED
jgi:hypothetical protein